MASFLRKGLRAMSRGGSAGSLDAGADEDEDHAPSLPDNGPVAGSAEQRRARAWSNSEKDRLAKLDYPFSKEQMESVTKMRKMLAEDLAQVPDYEEVTSDRRLMRFLRGHKFDLEVATDMYRKMLAWRKEYGADAIRQDIVENNLGPDGFPHRGRALRYYPSHCEYGSDAEGRPVHVEMIGHVSPRRVLSCVSEDEWVRHHVYCMEYNAIKLDKATQANGKLTRVVLVYDLAGIGPEHLRKHGWDLIKKTLKITQDCYPETMHKTYLLNAPKVFSLAWQIIKPCLAQRTVAKIEISGHNRAKLLESVPAECLPEALGGSRATEWPLVCDSDQYSKQDKEHHTMDVSKGGKSTVRVYIPANSFAVWGFFTKSGDVGASLQRFETSAESASEDSEAKEDDGATSATGPLLAEETFGRTESVGGSFSTTCPTELALTFDNSFSWVNKKTVHYYVRAVPIEHKKALDSPPAGRFNETLEHHRVLCA